MHVKDFDKYSELIAKFLAKESSLSEKEELFSWTSKDEDNRQFFEETEQVWNKLEGAGTSPFETDMDAAWAKIDAGTPLHATLPSNAPPLESSGKIISLASRMRRWSIAAAILLLAAFGLWWAAQAPSQPALVEIQTPDNDQKEITLPDGSQITLNENSTLTYSANFEIRNITLVGEAFFDVAPMKDSPFTISSGGATTTVVGTSFNVRAYPQEERIEVTVESGTVELAVTKRAAEPVELPAGTSGIVYKKDEKVERVEEKISNALAWKTFKLDFEDDLMIDVIATLERYFQTQIKVSNEMIYECHFTSPFVNPTLDEILNVIGASIGVEVQKKGVGYLLIGQGCQPNN